MSLIPSGFAKNSASGGAGFYDYPIEQSLRFDEGSSPTLTRTFSASDDKKKLTYSAWFKKCRAGGFFDLLMTSDKYAGIRYYSDSYGFEIQLYNSASSYFAIYGDVSAGGSAVWRDPSAWMHLVVTMDTTQATDTDRCKVFINGVQFQVTGTLPALNFETTRFNSAVGHTIGSPLNGYLAEVHFLDGIAADADSFGEFKSGVWKPIEYTGSYGTNGFYLDFDGTYYNDKSGNGNNFTANNLAATDVVLDSPTNNFATFSPLINRPTWDNLTYYEGNLKVYSSGRSDIAFTGFAPTSGKWYLESLKVDGTRTMYQGLVNINNVTGNHADRVYGTGNTTYDQYVSYTGLGAVYVNGSSVATGKATISAGDIVGVAFDCDAGSVSFYVNGTLQYTHSSNLSWLAEGACFFLQPDDDYAMANFGQDSSFAGNKTAQGNTDANGYGDFYYAPPSGYLALCTANLEVPDAMNPALDASPQDHFNTVLYTGTGSTQSITGVGFEPDWIWIHPRNNTGSHVLSDVVRGEGNSLWSDRTDAEQANASNGQIESHDVDGFTVGNNAGVGNVNGSGDSVVSWNWKANGSGVSNTDGSITSTVSANTDAGFSIVSYTGTGTQDTVGHGLSSAPELILAKSRSASSGWAVYHSSVGKDAYLVLNNTNASSSYSNYWGTSTPDASVFGVSDNTWNNNNGSMIAYCFHSVEGFSKFGSYTGNGSTDGTFCYTGFRPAFLLWKRTDNAQNWSIEDAARDNINPNELELFPNASNAEENNGAKIDFLSNGFKFRNTNANMNASGGTYIYMAFAENPLKFSTAV